MKIIILFTLLPLTCNAESKLDLASPPHHYLGNISGNHIEAYLTIEKKSIHGSYRYIKNKKTYEWLNIQGNENNNEIDLIESFQNKKTGAFTGKIANLKINGTWTSPEGRILYFELHDITPWPDYSFFLEKSSKNQEIIVKANGIAIQSLLIPSTGKIIAATRDDINFDGNPDFGIKISYGSTERPITLYWLYDPSNRKFSYGPESLQKIGVSGIDYQKKEIYSEWKNGYENSFLNIYKYINNDYYLIEENINTGTPGNQTTIRKKYKPMKNGENKLINSTTFKN